MSAVKNKSTMFWIHNVIMIAVTFGVGLIPPIGGDITPFGMRVLGVFLGIL